MSTLVRLAKVLGVPLDALLGLDASRSPSEDLRTKALLSRIAGVALEDLRFLIAVLGELQRWKRDAGSAR